MGFPGSWTAAPLPWLLLSTRTLPFDYAGPNAREPPSPRLIFMTYNGWVMLAVALGAFLGYVTFGSSTKITRETVCH